MINLNNKTVIKIVFLIQIYICFQNCSAFCDDEFEQLIDISKKSYSQLNDFTCLFHKKELINNELKTFNNVMFKFKKPASYYFRLTEGFAKEAEGIYVEGWNDNKLMLHPGKFMNLFNFSVDPKGKYVMKYNRHPIFDADLKMILDKIEKNYKKGKASGEGRVSIEKEEILDGRETVLIKAVFPKDRDYYGHIIYIFFDKQLNLPIKFEVFGWDNELLEMYYYSDLKINNGLTDKDFGAENPEYNF